MKSLLKKVFPKETRSRLRNSVESTSKGLNRLLFRALYYPLRQLSGGGDKLMCILFEEQELSAELIIRAYQQGMYVSPDEKTGVPRWYNPDVRGILPIEAFHVSKTLKKLVRKGTFEIRVDSDFEGVIRGCAERQSTWITPKVIAIYEKLFEMGIAHSVETWQDGKLVGGLYGLTIGSYFSGESQFHRVNDAGKVALVYLLEMLKSNDFMLHDVQGKSKFLTQFGSIEVSREEYLNRLTYALIKPASFEAISESLYQV
jgi:leucyl/phenylalanyl-tRNA--protein transferase